MIILASASPRRRDLLARENVPFAIHTAEVEELTSGMDPAELVQANAAAKAQAVAAQFPEQLVLGADTVVAHQGRILGKPASEEEAFVMLQSLSGQTHSVITGVALCRKNDDFCRKFAVVTEVRFLPFGEQTIRQYLSLVNVLDKAGAYALQEHGELLVDSVTGDPDNVVGLPVKTVVRHLREMGEL